MPPVTYRHKDDKFDFHVKDSGLSFLVGYKQSMIAKLLALRSMQISTALQFEKNEMRRSRCRQSKSQKPKAPVQVLLDFFHGHVDFGWHVVLMKDMSSWW